VCKTNEVLLQTYDNLGNVMTILGSLTSNQKQGSTGFYPERERRAGATRIAMRENSTLIFLTGDQLGSTSLVYKTDTGLVIKKLYKPWGESRNTSTTMPTKYQFTGQYRETSLGGADGLYYFVARWYDHYLNRWIQPDIIITDPYNPSAFDRYTYVYSNPLKNTDPSGYYVCTGYNKAWGDQTCYDIIDAYLNYLYKYGGNEGQELIEQFMIADSIYPVTFNFESINGIWAQTNSTFNRINITINAGVASNNSAMGYETSMFGHEIFHLLRQSQTELGTPEGEKEAYDFQAKLLNNMGITPGPKAPVSIISSWDAVKDRENIANLLGLNNTNWIMKINGVTGPIAYPIAHALIASYSSLTGCYDSVCVVPGSLTHQYSPPYLSIPW
jgi:RHS repeat-associated protein